MSIHGLNKTTLLDYPGKVAATIFMGSCNFRCPFCQNSSLVLHPAEEPVIPEDEILAFLKKRKGILDGVCISGGEPTLNPNLIPFLSEIRALGYMIKLDTNGTHPEIMKELICRQLIDMVAMDIKSSPENYGTVCGVKNPDMTPILKSVNYLLEGSIDYEFRTTVVRELHTASDFRKIGNWIAGAKAYYLQGYKDSETVLVPGFTAYTRAELLEFRNLLLQTIPVVEIRGVD